MADAESCDLTYDEVMSIVKNNQTPLEKEANAMWEKLDYLAANKPDEYKRFIDQQMKEGREYMKQQREGPKPNIPIPRFWVETELLDGDGKPTGIPRYFNVCESTAIEYTDDKNLNIYMSDLDNRQIDCVIHPKFMEKCLDDNLFLHDTIQLIFRTYMEEHTEREQVKLQYKHHPEGRKLRMKVPKAPGQAQEPKESSALDALSRVRHSEAARKMVADEEEERRRRLLQIRERGKQPGAPQGAVQQEKPKPKPIIEELPETKPPAPDGEKAPEYSIDVVKTADGAVQGCTVTLPNLGSVEIPAIDIELEGTSDMIIAIPSYSPLTLHLPCPAHSHRAKYLKKKACLRIEVQAP